MLARLDRFQRGHGAVGFPYAVVRKYLDDDGPRHAALITYYGFLSLFPLLLLGVAIVSRLLATDPDLRHDLITAIVPPTLQSTVDDAAAALPTSPVAFVLGVLGLVWSATGVVFAAYRTLNHVAGVRMRDLPVAGAYLRVLGVVIVLLTGVVAGGGLTVASAALPGLGAPDRLLAALGTGASAFAVLLFGVRILLVRRTSLADLWRPAAAGGLLLAVVLHVGAPVLTVLVGKAGPVYGAFATVAGLFTLLYLVSQALVAVAEAAAVRHARLWPRALDPAAGPTEADGRALGLLAREQERIPGQVVESRIVRDA